MFFTNFAIDLAALKDVEVLFGVTEEFKRPDINDRFWADNETHVVFVSHDQADVVIVLPVPMPMSRMAPFIEARRLNASFWCCHICLLSRLPWMFSQRGFQTPSRLLILRKAHDSGKELRATQNHRPTHILYFLTQRPIELLAQFSQLGAVEAGPVRDDAVPFLGPLAAHSPGYLSSVNLGRLNAQDALVFSCLNHLCPPDICFSAISLNQLFCCLKWRAMLIVELLARGNPDDLVAQQPGISHKNHRERVAGSRR